MLNAVQDTNICIAVPNFYLDMRLPSSYEGSYLLLCGLYIGKPSNRMSEACYVLKFSV
jgi:hypothetical protein